MQLSSILVLAAAAITAASPLAGQLQARDPSDKSGNSYVVLHVQQGTYPNTPEDSLSFFERSLKYRGPDGIDRTNIPCSQPWTDKNCYVSHNLFPVLSMKACIGIANKAQQQCTVSDGQFKSNIVVKACWGPPAKPEISFSYNGHDYNTWSGQSTCGHVKNSQPFGGTMDATCYFNA